jgi:dTDP-4-amino-4,6-dideoxygalactose transaminase
MTSLTWDRHAGHAWSYDVVALGFNYRIDEVRAALGRVQLKKLARNNELRRERTALYWELLQEHCPTIGLPFRDHPGLSACHLLPVLLPAGRLAPTDSRPGRGTPREAFMEGMKRRGIQTSIHYPPVHRFSAYRTSYQARSRPGLPLTEAIAAREVTLPLYPALSEANVRSVVEAVRDSLAEL